MILDPVTLRYAEALWNVSARAGRLERVRTDVARLGAALPAPTLAREQRRKQLLAKLSGADEYLTNLVGLLFDRRREEVLQQLADAFKRLELQSRNTVEGQVESARPIPSDLLAALGRELESVLGKAVLLENRIVPELLGGTRVTVANRMIDYSVTGRLESLRRALLDAPLGAAR